MSVNQKNENTSHKLWLNNREAGSVSGVNDVISFDLNEIVLETVMVYSDTKAMKKQSLMGRLFR